MMFNTVLTTLCASIALVSASPIVSRSTRSTYNVEIVNNCQETIWPAGWQTNTNGGVMDAKYRGTTLAASNSWNVTIPVTALGVQFWARQGCTGSGDSFTCTVGDCGGYECSHLVWQGGPIMAEFGSGLNTNQYNTNIIAYDISAIPGNNVGVEIVPSISSCESKNCPVTGCDDTQAWQSATDGYGADTICSNQADFTVTFCPSSTV